MIYQTVYLLIFLQILIFDVFGAIVYEGCATLSESSIAKYEFGKISWFVWWSDMAENYGYYNDNGYGHYVFGIVFRDWDVSSPEWELVSEYYCDVFRDDYKHFADDQELVWYGFSSTPYLIHCPGDNSLINAIDVEWERGCVTELYTNLEGNEYGNSFAIEEKKGKRCNKGFVEYFWDYENNKWTISDSNNASTTTTDTTDTTTTTTTTTTTNITSTTTTTTSTIETTSATTTTTTTTTDTDTTSTTITSIPTPIKDRCGSKFRNQKCTNDKCCSKYGWCGISDNYCKISKGCQSEFGKCEDDTTPINDRCGPKFKNQKCKNDKCCSKYGWCGVSDNHCKVTKGCQSEFGKCIDDTTPIKDRCGPKFKNQKCTNNKCCSKYGWCGTSDNHCKIIKGCQSEFGKCL